MQRNSSWSEEKRKKKKKKKEVKRRMKGAVMAVSQSWLRWKEREASRVWLMMKSRNKERLYFVTERERLVGKKIGFYNQRERRSNLEKLYDTPLFECCKFTPIKLVI